MVWLELEIIILRWNRFKRILVMSNTKMNFLKFKFIVCTLLLLNIGTAVISADVSPSQMIATSIEVLELKLGNAANKERLGDNRDELYSIIDNSLSPYFHKKYAGRLVLDKYWAAANQNQRKRFTEGLYQALIRSYAISMLNFDVSKISVRPIHSNLQDLKKITVKTDVDYKGELIPMSFSFGKFKEGWRFFDVSIEGVSYIRNYRNQFKAEIQANGLDAVILRLESQK
ncbi:MAG TPA: ABC transporter substrate-binding protein [Gammaproteobacteria bacterium]|nr:ABC transporter substrate-binding protein [Gammaproteobacteria bacterium]